MGQTQITQSHVIVVFGLDSKLCTTCHICDYPSSEEPDDCAEGWEPRRHVLSHLFLSCGITYVLCALRPETWTGIASTPPGRSGLPSTPCWPRSLGSAGSRSWP